MSKGRVKGGKDGGENGNVTSSPWWLFDDESTKPISNPGWAGPPSSLSSLPSASSASSSSSNPKKRSGSGGEEDGGGKKRQKATNDALQNLGKLPPPLPPPPASGSRGKAKGSPDAYMLVSQGDSSLIASQPPLAIRRLPPVACRLSPTAHQPQLTACYLPLTTRCTCGSRLSRTSKMMLNCAS